MIWLWHGQLLLLLCILYLYIHILCNFVCQPLKMIVKKHLQHFCLYLWVLQDEQSPNFRHVRPTPSKCTSDTKDIQ